mmetsp:Transcript_17301/g.42378  ORF Transcript_17301/g.42378 Transcript_17301/m.42378 type:complete len:271 (-) Transcript_17301:257-1069(-)
MCAALSGPESDPLFDQAEITEDTTQLQADNIFLLKGLLDEESQQSFYEALLAHSEDTIEVAQLDAAGCPFPSAPFPFLLYNNPTTKTGNVDNPPKFAIEFAQQAYEQARKLGEQKNNTGAKPLPPPTSTPLTRSALPSTEKIPEKMIDSCHAQLYPQGGEMAPHKDTGGTWGLSVSIGSDALFRVDKRIFRLCSGDVVVADFGNRIHSVRVQNIETAPRWWKESPYTFGASRCNVQFRCAKDYTGPVERHIPWGRGMVLLSKLMKMISLR